MKILFLLVLFISLANADFFVLQNNHKIKMQASKSSQIKLDSFRKLPKTSSDKNIINIEVSEKNFEFEDAHFRVLDLYPSREYSITAKTDKDKLLKLNVSQFKSAKVLQVFYHGTWNSILLDKPINILHNSFSKIDMKQKDLDVKKVQNLLKQARIAYPLDDKLKTLEMEINNRAANEFNKTSNHMQQGIVF